MTVVISETAAEGEAKAAIDVTDENGKVTVPPTTIDYTVLTVRQMLRLYRNC